jgi:imidazolonepropionase
MPVLKNIGSLATCAPGAGQSDIGVIPDAAMAWLGEAIRWVGAERDLPAEYAAWPAEDAGGRLVVPGLVDCHTHLAFAGWRQDEFEQKLLGRSYLDIAKSGGGILSTVSRTRSAPETELLERASGFLRDIARLGVTTVEAKSGYGLDLETELRLLRVYRALQLTGPCRVVATFLGAHTVPAEYRSDRAGYIDLVIDTMIPAVAAQGTARFCDVFVEESAFSVEEGRRILRAGKSAGLQPKLHADQLSSCGGAELAAEVGAISADHLERISEAGIAAMKRAGVVAVSLPLASLYLGHQPLPARRILDAGLPLAVATDFNPGSAPSYHLPFDMMLACTLQRMTPAEVLKGATLIAAQALGLQGQVGSLEPGKAADFAVIDAESVNHWMYHCRPNACARTVVGGQEVWSAAI